MAKIVLKDLRGINATKASLQLQPGETEFTQNIRNRPFFNWAKRRGVSTAIRQSSPVLGIFELEFDNMVVPVYQAGDTLTFFPSIPLMTGSANLNDLDDGGSSSFPVIDPIYPDPFPSYDPISNSGVVLFRVEDAMRAVQERYLRAGLSGVSWPNREFDANGNAINEGAPEQARSLYYNGAVGNVQFPPNGFYQHDLYWHDQKNGNPIGTRAAGLVNSIASNISDDTMLLNYIGVNSSYQPVVDGVASVGSIVRYATVAGAGVVSVWFAGAAPTATAANYRNVLFQCRRSIQLLLYISQSVTQVNTSGSTPLDTRNGGALNASYSTAQTQASSAWDSSSWAATGSPGIGLYEDMSIAGTYQATLVNYRGKIKSDLSPFVAGSAAIYLRTSAALDGSSNSPPTTADGTLHAYTTASVGSIYLSSTLAETKPSFTMVEPTTEQRGWSIQEGVAVIALQFNYVV